MRRCWIGVDPGLTGAIGAYYETGVVRVASTPIVNGQYAEDLMVKEIQELVGDCQAFAVVEIQQAFPAQGRSSVCSICYGFGVWVGALAGCRVPRIPMKPHAWKRLIGIPSGSDKEASRALALRLFPTLAPDLKRKGDHGRAEAALLAKVAHGHWVRLTGGGNS